MGVNYSEIQELLQQRADYQARLNLIPYDGGRIRGVPVTIGGSTYVPPIRIESVVVERIDEIRLQEKDAVDIAIEL